MIRRVFVVDTNVFVAGLITSEGRAPTALIVDAMLDGGMAFLLSPKLLNEYRHVLQRPAIANLHGLSHDQLELILVETTANAIWREPQPDREYVCLDQDDAHLWALLASEPSAVLITGDRLLIDNPRPGTSVITPSAWREQFYSG